MNDFCLAPGITEHEAAEALSLLGQAAARDEPVAAWSAGNARTAAFASKSLLKLLDARNIEEISNRLFEAGGMRIASLGAKLVPGGKPRLERFRFSRGAATRMFTFECRMVRLKDGREMLVAAMIDAPAALTRKFFRNRAAAPESKPKPKPLAVVRPEKLENELKSLVPENDPVRFLWRTDSSGRICEIGPPFSHFAGRPLLEVIDGRDPAQTEDLARHLGLRATFRCVAGLPSGASGAFAPVILAGMPKFDRDRRFEGYSGFGVARSAPNARPYDTRPPARERVVAGFPSNRMHQGALAHATRFDGGAVLDVMPVGALICAGRAPVFVNRRLLDALRYHDLAATLEAGAFEPVMNGLARLERGGEIVELRSGDGGLVSLRACARPFDWRGDRASLVMLQPPLEAGQAALESDLRRFQGEARELNAILDTAMDGLAILDAKGNIVSLNRSGEALFGWDENDLAGQPFTVLIAPESRARAQDYFEGVKSDGMISLLNDGREVLALARQGGTIPLFMTLGRVDAGALQEAGEEEIRFCALLRDMTHWKKIERELDDARQQAERASALKSELLAKVSHEIRTPLNAILGFAEVILEERFGPIGNDRYKGYLKDVHSSGALVMSIVNDLLDLSKIEAGKMDFDFAPVDANRIVTECVSIMQPQASRAGIVMRLSLAPRLPEVFADERSIRQIILNLLSNAVKFNVPGGNVMVATAITGSGQAALRIRDSGVGMSADDIEVALEPFRQVTASRVSGGTGLGLPLTKALAEANRATFSIKSEREEGTLVEIAFPPARAPAD